jgi:hypothetical protein
MAIAAIGELPLPLMNRSIPIHMVRAPGSITLKRFDEGDADAVKTLDALYSLAWQWGHAVKLDLDPAMPDGTINRDADNWRPLLSIANSFGPGWGELAREALAVFMRGRPTEELGVTLLRDIRAVFHATRGDRITSLDLVASLVDMDDAPWSEWRGVRDDESPRRLSQGQLAKTLRPFDIKPRTIRLTRGTAKGYLRAHFADAWESYCDDTEQAHTVRHLGLV